MLQAIGSVFLVLAVGIGVGAPVSGRLCQKFHAWKVGQHICVLIVHRTNKSCQKFYAWKVGKKFCVLRLH
jgi:hypothetical protein